MVAHTDKFSPLPRSIALNTASGRVTSSRSLPEGPIVPTSRFLYSAFVRMPAKGEIKRRPPSNRLATVLRGVMPPESAG